LDDVKVAIPVPENEVSAMKEGQTAQITVDALGGRKLRGTLTEKGITANPLTRAYTVKFSVDNRDGSLLPGMICTVALDGTDTTSTAGRAIVLPAQAVLLGSDNRNFVGLARDGKAERRFIEAGAITADGIAVASGLTPGDTVITAGMQKVSTGTPVSY
ncbi:MAG: efflux RND transporter periplasmic adaptor subunit, partial [Muribaculaceae bacterium]|nr:efflux RND transporter periplasmic adaptor subunit [Muribaculaceae bacterium]